MRHPLASFVALVLLLGGALGPLHPLLVSAPGCTMPCCKRSGRGSCCPRDAVSVRKDVPSAACRLSACTQAQETAVRGPEGQAAMLRSLASPVPPDAIPTQFVPSATRSVSRHPAPPNPPPRSLAS